MCLCCVHVSECVFVRQMGERGAVDDETLSGRSESTGDRRLCNMHDVI